MLELAPGVVARDFMIWQQQHQWKHPEKLISGILKLFRDHPNSFSLLDLGQKPGTTSKLRKTH